MHKCKQQKQKWQLPGLLNNLLLQGKIQTVKSFGSSKFISLEMKGEFKQLVV